MANLVINVIGVLLGGVAIAPLAHDLLGPDPKEATTVRIQLGSTSERSQSFDGNLPGASLWDADGVAIGFTPGSNKHIPQGNFVDIPINPRKEVGNIQAEYLSITSGNIDAVCISGVSVTFPDGAKAGFSGNAAAFCNESFWSNSRTPSLGQPSTGELEPPKCFWIDSDGSNGIPHQGIGIHLPSFSNTNQNLANSYNSKPDLMCKSGPRFRMYPKLKTEDSILVFPHPPEFITSTDDPDKIGIDKDEKFIIGNPGRLAAALVNPQPTVLPTCVPGRPCFRRRDGHKSTTDSSRKPKNTALPARRPLAESLIVSPHTYNSARALCESEWSFGQSFVSIHEKLFCDMTDKSLYYTCSDKIKTCCLDAQTETFHACQKDSQRPQFNSQRKKTDVIGPRRAGAELDPSWTKGHRIYDSVQRW